MAKIYAVDASPHLEDLIEELEENGVVCNILQSEAINEMLFDWHCSPALKEDEMGEGYVMSVAIDRASFNEILSDEGIDALASLYTYLMIESNTMTELVDIQVLSHKGDFSYVYESRDGRKPYIKRGNYYGLSNLQTGDLNRYVH